VVGLAWQQDSPLLGLAPCETQGYSIKPIDFLSL